MPSLTRKSIARETLNDARAYLELAESTHAEERSAYTRHLKTAIVYGRSVTLHIQREFRHRPGFKAWYSDIQEQLIADPLFTFFRGMRNVILKEGPPAVHGVVSVTLNVTTRVAVSLDAVVIRDKPWFLRSLRVLVSDLRAAVLRKVRTWWRHWQQSRDRRQAEEGTTCVTYALRFDDPAWNHRSAADLVHEYLDKLEPVVTEAEIRFAHQDGHLSR